MIQRRFRLYNWSFHIHYFITTVTCMSKNSVQNIIIFSLKLGNQPNSSKTKLL